MSGGSAVRIAHSPQRMPVQSIPTRRVGRVGSSNLSSPTENTSPSCTCDWDFLFVDASPGIRSCQMRHWVYIIYSDSRDRYYIGSSADPKGRLERHNSANRGYTASGQPWRIVYTEEHMNKTFALRRERQLKSWKNRGRLEALINQR